MVNSEIAKLSLAKIDHRTDLAIAKQLEEATDEIQKKSPQSSALASPSVPGGGSNIDLKV